MSTLSMKPGGRSETAAPKFDFAKLVAHAPPTWVFKQDGHSRVWQVDGPEGPLVVKRYQYLPPVQMVSSLLGRHPAQREVKMSKLLEAKGVPVAPPLAAGVQWGATGARCWLVTPYLGRSVQQLGRQGELESPRFRKFVIDGVADVTAKLLESEYYHPDHRASNIILDARQRFWLVDVEGVRPAKKRPHMLRTLAILLRTLALEEIPPAERLYCLKQIRDRCDFLGPLDRLAAEVDAVKLPRR